MISAAKVQELNTHKDPQKEEILRNYVNVSAHEKYYDKMLSDFENYNKWMEIAIAFGATSNGGIAGLAIWGTLPGHYIWLVFSALAAILGFVKPYLALGDRVKLYSEQAKGHSDARIALEEIIRELNLGTLLSASNVKRINSVRIQVETLIKKDHHRREAKLEAIESSVRAEKTYGSVWKEQALRRLQLPSERPPAVPSAA